MERNLQSSARKDKPNRNILNEASTFKGGSNSTPVKLPRFLTPKLAYLIGSLRDGSLPEVYNNQYEIQYSQKSLQWLEDVIIPLIEKIFKTKTVVKKYGEQTPRVKIYSKPIYIFIRKFFEYPKGLQVTWQIPTLIRNSSQEIKKWYIAGFFDAEGEINVKQKRLVIHHSWNGQNPVVLTQLKEILLRDFGLENKISKPHKEKNFPSFDLIIFGKNIWSFYQKIGTLHPEKISKFRMLRVSLS